MKISNLSGVDKDSYLARLAKLRLSLHFGGNVKVIVGDSLRWSDDVFLESELGNNHSNYSVCFTNPALKLILL